MVSVNDQALSEAIEDLLVSRNVRHMQVAQAALPAGYCARGAKLLRQSQGQVIIGTGFPVNDTFETDGPVGAIALYETLEKLGAQPWLACAPPLAHALLNDYRVLTLNAANSADAEIEARAVLDELQPDLVLSIERPGQAIDGEYYNMRGENISARCGIFDPYLQLAQCPTVAIGDGGNEIGMGNICEAIAGLDIKPSATKCDELMVADVSNWGAYGLIAMLGKWADRDFLEELRPGDILDYLSARGSVDGVTRENTLTEDGMEPGAGEEMIAELRALVAHARINTTDREQST